jgi:hypothetical protein
MGRALLNFGSKNRTGLKDRRAYIYKKDECLLKDIPMLSQLRILAEKKSYIDSVGVNNLQVKKVRVQERCFGRGCYLEEVSDKNVFMSDEVIIPYNEYVDNNDPLIKETIDYTIAGFSGKKLILYKSRQIFEYNNGAPKKIETFANPLKKAEPNNQNPQPDKITPTPTPPSKIPPVLTDQPNVTPTPSPTPAKRGFWQSIICFFRGCP